MAPYISVFVLLCSLVCSSIQLTAQETPASTESQIVIVVMQDGTKRIGHILTDDGREILLNTPALGNLYIQKSDIMQIESVKEDELEEFDGDFRNAGPFTTRYYFTTNALPIKKRDDYAMVHIYGPEVHFSVSDRLSLGIMTTWAASPFILAAKYSIPTKNEKINIGFGTLIGSSGYFNEFKGYGGLHWATVSIGDRLRNVSFSAGYGYVEPNFQNNVPIPGTYYAKSGDYYPDIPYTDQDNQAYVAPVISIAGISKIGGKSSFFFDSMIFFYSHEDTDYDWQYVEENDRTTSIIITSKSYTQQGVAMYLMPGMRIQTRANRAFQVALAGVILSEKDPDGGPRDLTTFPIPTCSWFFKF